MTSSTRRWNGSTGTTTDGCTASSATSHPPSSKPPTTLNQRHSNRSRHKYEVGNEPETVHDDRFDHAGVLLQRSSIATAFFAEHSPCLEVCDGMFDGGAGLAQRGVELDLAGAEVDAGESLVRDGVDALDADVAQVGHRRVGGEHPG